MIKYSEITEMAPVRCTGGCGEMYITPCCKVEVCIYCEDACDSCRARIDWTA